MKAFGNFTSGLADVSGKLTSGMASGLNLRDKLTTASSNLTSNLKAGYAAAASAGGVRTPQRSAASKGFRSARLCSASTVSPRVHMCPHHGAVGHLFAASSKGFG
jgi:hypothetical protein